MNSEDANAAFFSPIRGKGSLSHPLSDWKNIYNTSSEISGSGAKNKAQASLETTSRLRQPSKKPVRSGKAKPVPKAIPKKGVKIHNDRLYDAPALSEIMNATPEQKAQAVAERRKAHEAKRSKRQTSQVKAKDFPLDTEKSSPKTSTPKLVSDKKLADDIDATPKKSHCKPSVTSTSVKSVTVKPKGDWYKITSPKKVKKNIRRHTELPPFSQTPVTSPTTSTAKGVSSSPSTKDAGTPKGASTKDSVAHSDKKVLSPSVKSPRRKIAYKPKAATLAKKTDTESGDDNAAASIIKSPRKKSRGKASDAPKVNPLDEFASSPTPSEPEPGTPSSRISQKQEKKMGFASLMAPNLYGDEGDSDDDLVPARVGTTNGNTAGPTANTDDDTADGGANVDSSLNGSDSKQIVLEFAVPQQGSDGNKLTMPVKIEEDMSSVGSEPTIDSGDTYDVKMQKMLQKWIDLNDDADEESLDTASIRNEVNLDDNVLDHVVLAAPDFGAALKKFEEMTGIRPTKVGPLQGLGARTAHVGLDNNRYIEILAPDNRGGPLGVELKKLPAGTLVPFHYAIRSTEMDRMVQGYITDVLGWKPDHILMVQALPDTSLRQFDLLTMYGHNIGGASPYYVKWKSIENHPTASIPLKAKLTSFSVTAPEGHDVHKLIFNIGGISPRTGEPKLELKFDTPKGPVVFSQELPQGYVFPGYDDENHSSKKYDQYLNADQKSFMPEQLSLSGEYSDLDTTDQSAKASTDGEDCSLDGSASRSDGSTLESAD